MSNFEERLLGELRKMVPSDRVDRGQRRRGRRFAVAGGLAVLVAAAAAAGTVFLSAGTQAAYAVTRNADGTVTVEIDSMRDAAGLQAKLRAAGVNAVVAYLPAGKMCRFTPLGPRAREASSSAVRSLRDGGYSFTISGDRPSGATMVISTQTIPGGGDALGIGWAQGDIQSCEVVDAPAGSGPLGGPPVPPQG